jgi:AraC-like DNA-binding protein
LGRDWWNRKTYFPFNAIYLTKVGSFNLKINQVWYHVKPNQIVFIPSGSELVFDFDGNGPLEKYFVHFDLDYGIGALGTCFNIPCTFNPTDETRLTNVFEELKHNFVSDTMVLSSIATSGALMSLVAEVIKQSGANFTYTKEFFPKDMRETVKYIENNCNKPISVTDLAKIAGYSPTHFTKKFIKTFGCSPTAYMANVKIEHAKLLLKEKCMPVSEIAYSLGFSDTGYFSNFFKAKTGLSPAYYRKKNNSL